MLRITDCVSVKKFIFVVLLQGLIVSASNAAPDNQIKLELLCAASSVLACIEFGGEALEQYDSQFECGNAGLLWNLKSENLSLQIRDVHEQGFDFRYGVRTGAVSGEMHFEDEFQRDCDALIHLYLIGTNKIFSFLRPISCTDKNTAASSLVSEENYDSISMLNKAAKANKIALVSISGGTSIELATAYGVDSEAGDCALLHENLETALGSHSIYKACEFLSGAFLATKIAILSNKVYGAANGQRFTKMRQEVSVLVGELSSGFVGALAGKSLGVVIGFIIGGPGGALICSTVASGCGAISAAQFGAHIAEHRKRELDEKSYSRSGATVCCVRSCG